MSALEDLANSPDPQPAQSGSALEALANMPDPTPTDVAHQPVSLSGLKQTLSTKEGWQAAADPLTGFAKGAGDTVHGVGELLRKVGNYGSRNSAHPGEGDRVIPPVGQKALDQMSTDQPGNYAQHTGKALEAVAEFMTGEGAVDEAGKVLSVGDKLKTLGAVGKFIESHPFMAKMLSSAGKTGLVTGAQTTAKTGSPAEGTAAAGVGAGLGVVGSLAGAGVKYIRELYKPLIDVTEGTIDTSTGTVHPSTGVIEPKTGVANISSVQPVVQKGIRDTLTDTAKEAGVTPPSSASIRDVVTDTAEQIKAKSQPVFQQLDKLSEGKFSDAQAAAKRYRGALDKAGKDAYQAALDKQDALFEKFKNSFDPKAFDQAKADWKQYRALQEVGDAINMTTAGQRPEIAAASASKQPSEAVNPKQLLNRLNRLYNEGTLETALGKDQAHALLEHAGAAQGATETILENNRNLVSANRAKNTATVEGNKAHNKATIASNYAKNDAVKEANKAANEAKLRGRRVVAAGAVGALTAGAAGAGSAVGRKYLKDTLGGQ